MASGSTITYNDLSSLRDKMNTILNGTGVHGGYNQIHSIAANPSTGDTIDDSYHDSLHSAAAKISNYYNISNTFTAVDAGTTIDWDHYGAVAGAFNTDITARFDAPWSYSDWDTSVQNETSETASNWNGTRTQIVKFAFGSAANLNAWFAAGGELRVSASHNDTTSNQQGTSWEQLTGEMGTFTYSVRPEDTSNVDTRTRYKHSDLSGSYVVHKKEIADDADYTANYIQISAYVSGGDLYIKTELADAHVARTGSGSGYGGAWSWTGADTVPGTSTVTIASKKLTNASGSVTLTNPTSTVTDSL
ncbi:MAG: hypothetical protein H8D95_00710 [Candidatus Endolissoclinum sp.]|nr:hypothetical protein [Candidatus Endolissoclinum sp.]